MTEARGDRPRRDERIDPTGLPVERTDPDQTTALTAAVLGDRAGELEKP